MSGTTFAYKVKDRSGRLIEGTLEARSEEVVASTLRGMGYVPVSIERSGRSALQMEIKLRGDKVSLRDVAIFSRQLTTMITSSLSLVRALSILAKQTESPALAKVINEVKDDIERGLSLSQAIVKHPKVFPPVYQAMVRAGETGGVLDDVLVRLADSLERQLALRGKVRSAMTYPIAVLCIVVLIVTAMLLFVVPMFQDMYANLGGELPLPTRLLVGFSDLVKKTWFLGVGALIAGGIGLRRWIRTEDGRFRFDTFLLRLPVFGKLLHKTALTRGTRTLAALVRSGVPIMEALDIAAETSGNAVVRRAVVDARRQVGLGTSLATALTDHPVMPPMVVQMIAVGEETGALDDMLDKLGDFYDREVEATVDALTSLIEPMLMVLMGVTVGGMIVALYLPMFNIINLVK